MSEFNITSKPLIEITTNVIRAFPIREFLPNGDKKKHQVIFCTNSYVKYIVIYEYFMFETSGLLKGDTIKVKGFISEIFEEDNIVDTRQMTLVKAVKKLKFTHAYKRTVK